MTKTDELMALVEVVLHSTWAVRRPQPELSELRTAIEAALTEAREEARSKCVDMHDALRRIEHDLTVDLRHVPEYIRYAIRREPT